MAGLAGLAASAFLVACGDNTATVVPAATPTRAATPVPTEAAKADKAAHWTYEGHEGPDSWGELDPAYAVCKTGQSQTPIDLPASGQPSPFKKIAHNYGPSAVNYVNNGHTIQVDYDKGSSLTIDGKQYDLAQFHFHAPSEHHINGQHKGAHANAKRLFTRNGIHKPQRLPHIVGQKKQKE